MTCTQLDSENWRIRFDEPDAYLVVHILAQLERHYRLAVDDLSPAQQAYWRGNVVRSTEASPEEIEASNELLSEARAELRSERLNLVEAWLRDFELAEDRDPWVVELDATERDEFIAMINDRRLLLALEFAITEKEMDQPLQDFTDDTRRMVRMEIGILGSMIGIILDPEPESS